jgi:hypothetical protein
MTIAADSTAVIEALVASRYRAMSPIERCRAAASMSEPARQIGAFILPP